MTLLLIFAKLLMLAGGLAALLVVGVDLSHRDAVSPFHLPVFIVGCGLIAAAFLS